jgi:hypothetical protein
MSNIHHKGGLYWGLDGLFLGLVGAFWGLGGGYWQRGMKWGFLGVVEGGAGLTFCQAGGVNGALMAGMRVLGGGNWETGGEKSH